MPSLRSITLWAVALLATAQAQYTIVPSSVDLATRQKWCESQRAACPLLCTQLPGGSMATAANTCDAATLTYSCVCSTGMSPNATEYSQTLPYFICVQWGTQCVAACGNGNTACQSDCRQNHPCGAQNPVRYNTTSTASTETATATDGSASSTSAVVYNGLGPDSTAAAAGSSSSAKSAASAALGVGKSFGAAIIGGAIFTALLAI